MIQKDQTGGGGHLMSENGVPVCTCTEHPNYCSGLADEIHRLAKQVGILQKLNRDQGQHLKRFINERYEYAHATTPSTYRRTEGGGNDPGASEEGMRMDTTATGWEDQEESGTYLSMGDGEDSDAGDSSQSSLPEVPAELS